MSGAAKKRIIRPHVITGPKGLRVGRRVIYNGKKGEFVAVVTALASGTAAEVKRYDTDEKIIVSRVDLKYVPKGFKVEKKIAPIQKTVKEASIIKKKTKKTKMKPVTEKSKEKAKEKTGAHWKFIFSDYGHDEDEITKFYVTRNGAIKGAISFLSTYDLFTTTDPEEAIKDFKKMVESVSDGEEVLTTSSDAFDSMDMRIEIKRIKIEDEDSN